MTNYTGWKHIPTTQSKEILTVLMASKQSRKASLIISDTGLGKTNTIKTFKQAEKDGTIAITVGDSYRLPDVLDAILEELQAMRYEHLTVRGKMKMIVEALREVSVKHPQTIIIDEAENLKPNSLRMIKELYDHVIDYSSVVLIGTPQILDTIHNTRKRNRTGVPQLWRRFKAGTRYITKLNKARDFKAFFEQYSIEDEGLQNLIVHKAENYGELHDYLEPALRFCQQKSQPLTEKIFRNIHKLEA